MRTGFRQIAVLQYTQAALPNGPQLGPTGAQLGPTGAQLGSIWNAAWVVPRTEYVACKLKTDK